MQKLAHLVKTAEVRGVLAYLVDNGLIEVESEEDFDALVQEVTAALGEEEYDLDSVLNKTSEILEAANQQGEEKQQEKSASEMSEDELQQYMGKLTMAKMAGEISEEDFEKEASAVTTALKPATRLGKATGKATQSIINNPRKAVAGTAAGGYAAGKGGESLLNKMTQKKNQE